MKAAGGSAARREAPEQGRLQVETGRLGPGEGGRRTDT